MNSGIAYISISFVHVLSGIIFSDDRFIAYSLICAGVLLAIADAIIKKLLNFFV